MFRDAIDFYIFILYLPLLLSSFISVNGILIDSLRQYFLCFSKVYTSLKRKKYFE